MIRVHSEDLGNEGCLGPPPRLFVVAAHEDADPAAQVVPAAPLQGLEFVKVEVVKFQDTLRPESLSLPFGPCECRRSWRRVHSASACLARGR